MTMTDSKDVVRSFLKMLTNEDFTSARNFVTNDMKFVGVLGTREGAESYFTDMEKMKLKYTVKQIISEGDDACVMYDIAMSGINVPAIGWYHLEKGKIKEFKVLFDPRPVLKQ
jgi:hypothetical protein